MNQHDDGRSAKGPRCQPVLTGLVMMAPASPRMVQDRQAIV